MLYLCLYDAVDVERDSMLVRAIRQNESDRIPIKYAMDVAKSRVQSPASSWSAELQIETDSSNTEIDQQETMQANYEKSSSSRGNHYIEKLWLIFIL